VTKDANLGLPGAFACALFPPFGWVVALVSYRNGLRRRALQALTLSIVLPPWFVLMQHVSGPLHWGDGYHLNSDRYVLTWFLLIAGFAGLPVATLRLLARLCPETSPVNAPALRRDLLKACFLGSLLFLFTFASLWVAVDLLHVKRAIRVNWGEKDSWISPRTGGLEWVHLIEDKDSTSLFDAHFRAGGFTSIGSKKPAYPTYSYFDFLGFHLWVGQGYVWNLEIPYWFLLLAPIAAAGYCFYQLQLQTR